MGRRLSLFMIASYNSQTNHDEALNLICGMVPVKKTSIKGSRFNSPFII
jgi:hypothetical protein